MQTTLYFLHLPSNEGENYALFIEAEDPAQAVRFWWAHCDDNGFPAKRHRIKPNVWIVPTLRGAPRVIHWHKTSDIRQVSV